MPSESAILSSVVALPIVGAAAVLALPARAGREWPRGIATIFTVGTLFLLFMATRRVDWASAEVQLLARFGPPLGADVIALVLGIVGGAMGFLACWASYGVRAAARNAGAHAHWRVKSYFAILLFVLAMLLGALFSPHGIAVGIFLLAAVVGIYPLILYWGHERREAAARRMLAFSLVAIGLFCISAELGRAGSGGEGSPRWFWLNLLSLGLLIALVPLHRWLLDVVAEASTPVAMLVTSALQLVVGSVLLRACAGGPPHGAWPAVIGAGTAIYAALAILAGTSDLRRVVGYVSTAQMGLFLLALSTRTVSGGAGAVLLLVAHSVSIAMLLFVAGVIRDRTGHCDIRKLGGIGEHMPEFGAWSALAFLTAMGVPGLAVFPGLFLTLMGAFQAARQFPETGPTLWPGVLAIVAVMLLAGGLLWTYQRVFLGGGRPEHSNVAPLSFTEKMVLGLLAIFSLAVGIAPALLSDATKVAIQAWASP